MCCTTAPSVHHMPSQPQEYETAMPNHKSQPASSIRWWTDRPEVIEICAAERIWRIPPRGQPGLSLVWLVTLRLLRLFVIVGTGKAIMLREGEQTMLPVDIRPPEGAGRKYRGGG